MMQKRKLNSFNSKMWSRLKKGEKKYGDKYINADIVQELEEELVDLANYAFMLWLKTQKMKERIPRDND